MITTTSIALVASGLYAATDLALLVANRRLVSRGKIFSLSNKKMLKIEPIRALNDGYIFKMFVRDCLGRGGIYSFDSTCVRYGYDFCTSKAIRFNIDDSKQLVVSSCKNNFFNNYTDYELFCQKHRVRAEQYSMHNAKVQMTDIKTGDELWVLSDPAKSTDNEIDVNLLAKLNYNDFIKLIIRKSRLPGRAFSWVYIIGLTLLLILEYEIKKMRDSH